jgi:hypothetical protein
LLNGQGKFSLRFAVREGMTMVSEVNASSSLVYAESGVIAILSRLLHDASGLHQPGLDDPAQ